MTPDIELALGHIPETGEGVKIRMTKAPHILVAGMTGAGKSVLIHDLLCQIISQYAPSQASLILVDPKRVEFAAYKKVPHLAYDPVYDDRQIEYLLNWTVAEMHNRFATMERRGWRDVTGYAPWPRMFVVVDELANLMLRGKQGKKFERLLVEIASMGRSAGIHLILATQRPDATVISGLIRANVPTRVALPTLTATDSRIILDVSGAEQIAIPQRLIRLPGQRDLIHADGRFWTDQNIRQTLRKWEGVIDHVRS